MNYQEDYNKAIFLNAYGHGKPIKEDSEYQRYFEFECGITNPRSYHKHLIKDGYLCPSPIKDIVSSFKVDDLKMICDSLNIPKSGKKGELVNRIVANCSIKDIKPYISETLYSLSDKGSDFLNTHEDYVTLHKHKNWGISLEEYIEYKNTLSFKSSFSDVAWGIFNKRIVEFSNNYGFLRNNYLNMSQLLNEEKRYGEELKYLLYVLFFDICGTDTIEHLEYCNSKDEALKNYDYFVFRTSIPNSVAQLKDYYSESFVDDIYNQYQMLPLALCDIATFKQLILDIFNDVEHAKEKYKEILFENYKKYIEFYFSNHLTKRQEYELWLNHLEKDVNAEESKQLKHSNSASVSQKNNGGCLSSVLMCVLLILLIILF